MPQNAYRRLLWRIVDAAIGHVATGGREQQILTTVLPKRVLGKPLQLHGAQGFTGVRGYAAPVKKGSKGPPKRNEVDAAQEPVKCDRRINRAIFARHIRLVDEHGKSHEVVTRQEALLRATRAGLDLVEVDGKSDPVVCKLMDYEQERLKEKKRERELRKKQVEKRRMDEVKEIRYGFKTEQKDLEMKADMAKRILERGHRVRVTILLQGKAANVDPAEQLQKMITLLEEIATIEAGPRLDQNRIWVLLRSKTAKQGAKAAKAVSKGKDVANQGPNELNAVNESDGEGSGRDFQELEEAEDPNDDDLDDSNQQDNSNQQDAS